MYQQRYISVVIPAAGHGKRMKTGVSKQYIEIDGMPILAITVSKFQKADFIDEIVLAVGEEEIGYVEKYIKERYGFDKIKKIVVGGKERQDSVFEGLKAVSNETDIIMIHDAVRPLIKEKDILRIVEETIRHDACVLGVRVKDTIKEVDDNKNVVTTPNRSRLFAIQTPQAFKKSLIYDAYLQGIENEFEATDDAMLVEKYSKTQVRVVEGSYDNIKITTPEDLILLKEYISSNLS